MGETDHGSRHRLGFFDQSVLAAYMNEPDKYLVRTDNFEGEVRLTEQYWRELKERGRRDQSINVRFGYRTLRDGSLAVVAFMPDLYGRSRGHLERWKGFELASPLWREGHDERFDLWRRYLEGDWDVDNGPRARLEQVVRAINALTCEVVSLPLFKYTTNPALIFPAAGNTHQYQDAHRELYGYIIDGLDKRTIDAIATHRGMTVKVDSKKTIEALKLALPTLAPGSRLWSILDKISDERRLAGHAVRDPAKPFPAFEKFAADLEGLVGGLEELHRHMETVLEMDGEVAIRRQESKRMLPKIINEPMAHYSICQVKQIEGKTIAKVEFGERQDQAEVHRSEAIIIHFTDGSILGIDTGSNAWNLAQQHDRLDEQHFHVDFFLTWAPPCK